MRQNPIKTLGWLVGVVAAATVLLLLWGLPTVIDVLGRPLHGVTRLRHRSAWLRSFAVIEAKSHLVSPIENIVERDVSVEPQSKITPADCFDLIITQRSTTRTKHDGTEDFTGFNREHHRWRTSNDTVIGVNRQGRGHSRLQAYFVNKCGSTTIVSEMQPGTVARLHEVLNLSLLKEHCGGFQGNKINHLLDHGLGTCLGSVSCIGSGIGGANHLAQLESIHDQNKEGDHYYRVGRPPSVYVVLLILVSGPAALGLFVWGTSLAGDRLRGYGYLATVLGVVGLYAWSIAVWTYL